MQDIKQPTKEQVRQFIAQRQAERKPPQSLKEIRRQLGWNLVDKTSSCRA